MQRAHAPTMDDAVAMAATAMRSPATVGVVHAVVAGGAVDVATDVGVSARRSNIWTTRNAPNALVNTAVVRDAATCRPEVRLHVVVLVVAVDDVVANIADEIDGDVGVEAVVVAGVVVVVADVEIDAAVAMVMSATQSYWDCIARSQTSCWAVALRLHLAPQDPSRWRCLQLLQPLQLRRWARSDVVVLVFSANTRPVLAACG